MARNYSDKRSQKETIDSDNSQLELTEFEYNRDKSANSGMMENITQNSYAKDFAKLDTPSDSPTQGQSEIEHFPEAKIYSKRHEFEKDTLVQGTESGRNPKYSIFDDTAKGKKPQKSDYTDEDLDEDVLSGLA